MKVQYNLNYISGIAGYNKRAIYTLKINEDGFMVNGLLKSKKFSYIQVIEIKYGKTDEFKELQYVKETLYENVKLLDRRLNSKLQYCLIIVLEDTTIIFAEEHEISIKNAYNKLMLAYKKYRVIK